jgi:hypothetical protein
MNYYRLDFKPDPRYEPLMKFKGEKEEEKEKVRIKRVQKNPNDLRLSSPITLEWQK